MSVDIDALADQYNKTIEGAEGGDEPTLTPDDTGSTEPSEPEGKGEPENLSDAYDVESEDGGPTTVTRKERRSNRWNQNVAAMKEAKALAAKLQRENDALKAARSLQAPQAPSVSPQLAPGAEKPSAADKERELRDLITQTPADDPRQARWQLEHESAAQSARQEEVDRQVKAALAAHGDPQRIAQDAVQKAEMSRIESEFSDVVKVHRGEAQDALGTLVAQGHADDFNTLRMALSQVRARYSSDPMAQKSATNVGSRGQSGGSSDGSNPIRLNEFDRHVALNMPGDNFKGLSDNDKIRLYVKLFKKD